MERGRSDWMNDVRHEELVKTAIYESAGNGE